MKQLVAQYLKGDKVIWMVCLFLGLVSILAVYSSISSLAYKKMDGNTSYFLFKHGIMLVASFAVIYFVHKINYRYFSRMSQIAIGLAIIMLVLTLLIGVNLNEASRWIKIPIINQNFQTSDFAKIALIAYLARMITVKRDVLNDFKKGVLPVLLPIGLICGLILPANFSTAIMLFVVCLILLFVGGMKFKFLVMIVTAAGLGFVLLLVMSSYNPNLLPRADTWRKRIVNFESGDSEANYQVEHAMMAIKSGGILPSGPGSGDSRNYLPHPYSDMIYAFIIEEYGAVVGGFGVLLLYLILLYRVLRLARKCTRHFGSLLVIGLGLLIVIQAFINMGVAVNLIPVTGQPLPFVSMGGTSTLFTGIAMGIILSVSNAVYEGKEETNTIKKRKKYAVA